MPDTSELEGCLELLKKKHAVDLNALLHLVWVDFLGEHGADLADIDIDIEIGVSREDMQADLGVGIFGILKQFQERALIRGEAVPVTNGHDELAVAISLLFEEFREVRNDLFILRQWLLALVDEGKFSGGIRGQLAKDHLVHVDHFVEPVLVISELRVFF